MVKRIQFLFIKNPNKMTNNTSFENKQTRTNNSSVFWSEIPPIIDNNRYVMSPNYCLVCRGVGGSCNCNL
jgi:hypothetical protein